MRRPCSCDDVRRCRLCWLFHHDERYRALWNENERMVERRALCVHLGRVVDRLGCPCERRWKRQCDLHEITTLDQCRTCGDYEPDD